MGEARRFEVEFRAEVDGNTIIGHAAVFNQVAEVGRGYERIAPTAFDAVLRSADTDVVALFNHDPNLVLGRQSAGNLRISTDAGGLRFEVEPPDTSAGRDLRELVRTGMVKGASFAFIPGKEKMERTKSGKVVRVHESVEALIDVSPATLPAYPQTSIKLRAIDLGGVSAPPQEQALRARHRSRTK